MATGRDSVERPSCPLNPAIIWTRGRTGGLDEQPAPRSWKTGTDKLLEVALTLAFFLALLVVILPWAASSLSTGFADLIERTPTTRPMTDAAMRECAALDVLGISAGPSDASDP
jgi:hypothetical protein